MRILMLVDRFEAGGVETHTLSLCHELLQRGHEIFIYTAAALPGNIEYLQRQPNFQYALWAQVPLEQLGEFNPDVIHAHPFESIRKGVQLAKSLQKPFFITSHGWYPVGVSRTPGGQETCKAVSKIIAVDFTVVSFLEKDTGCPEKIALIPNGVDLEYFHPLEFDPQYKTELGLDPTRFTIVSVSRLGDGKQNLALQLMESLNLIAKEVKGVNLVIVGHGPYYSAVEEKAKEIGEQNDSLAIQVVGHQFDIRKYLAAGDLVVGCGRAALEASACRRPVFLAFNTGFKELFRPVHYEKFLYRYRTEPSLSMDEICDFLKRSIRREIDFTPAIEECYRLVHQFHSIKEAASQHESIYQDAIISTENQ